MYFLAIDTATNSGGVALSRNTEVVGSAMLKTPLRYSDKVLHYVDFVLRHLGLQLADVDCFVVPSGPGSFTGLRIGLATVKAMCQALDKPVVGVSTLAALAFRFRHVGEWVAPMIDARRQQIYGALYRCSDHDCEEIDRGSVGAPAEWLKGLPPRPLLFVGDGAQMYRRTVEALRPESRVLPSDNCVLNELCALGYRNFLKGSYLQAAALRAEYIRPSDAEMAKADS